MELREFGGAVQVCVACSPAGMIGCEVSSEMNFGVDRDRENVHLSFGWAAWAAWKFAPAIVFPFESKEPRRP
jgi:hypothetical protein